MLIPDAVKWKKNENGLDKNKNVEIICWYFVDDRKHFFEQNIMENTKKGEQKRIEKRTSILSYKCANYLMHKLKAPNTKKKYKRKYK